MFIPNCLAFNGHMEDVHFGYREALEEVKRDEKQRPWMFEPLTEVLKLRSLVRQVQRSRTPARDNSRPN